MGKRSTLFFTCNFNIKNIIVITDQKHLFSKKNRRDLLYDTKRKIQMNVVNYKSGKLAENKGWK